MVNIEFLGPINRDNLSLDISNLSQLSEHLKADEEISSWLEKCAVAVNDTMICSRDYELNDGDKVKLQEYNGTPINIQLDPSCELEVIETPPGEKGDTATGWKKPATLSTWLVVQVPLFINVWDTIKVDTRTKDYLSRA